MKKYPILGRSVEIVIFKQMMDSYLAQKGSISKNVLLIKGEPRIGKTRLLDEMLYSAQGKALVHKVTLNPSDYKV
jgi:Predicted ATPase